MILSYPNPELFLPIEPSKNAAAHGRNGLENEQTKCENGEYLFILQRRFLRPATPILRLTNEALFAFKRLSANCAEHDPLIVGEWYIGMTNPVKKFLWVRSEHRDILDFVIVHWLAMRGDQSGALRVHPKNREAFVVQELERYVVAHSFETVYFPGLLLLHDPRD
jgi:hypothetical protein